MADRDCSAVLSAIKMSSAMPSEHQEVLHAVVSAIAASDMTSLGPYFTEDIELHIHGFAPIAGSWSGRDDVIAAATRNYQKLAQQNPHIEITVEQDDHVVWLVHESGRINENSQHYDIRGVIWWTFNGTQIRRIEEFIHTSPPA